MSRLDPNLAEPLGRRAQAGAALAVAVHVLLLFAVLAQVVYLASRHRLRLDLTSDRLWSSTDSTRRLVQGLEQPLLIEAYCSAKDKLPVNLRDSRTVLDNFLDELENLAGGKLVVLRYDPNADKAIADRCSRIGVEPEDLRSSSASSVSLDRHWQGLRLRYGGKQKVLAKLAPTSSFQAEALITPAIKEVLTAQKPRFGYMEWPVQAVGQQQPGGIGWNALRTVDGIAKRYEFQNFKDEDAPLLPDDLQTLFLFRPKELSDRLKYVLDQFVVRGGTLVAFVDAAEYGIGPRRNLTYIPVGIDAPGTKKRFVDQLAHYGVDWRPKVLADLSQEAFVPRDRRIAPFEYLARLQQGPLGPQFDWVPYPYFFHAVHKDWRLASDELARDASGTVDTPKAQRFRELFAPGLPSQEFLFDSFRQLQRGPGFYWPTWVGLRQRVGAGGDDLPDGVTGRVLLWSSPRTLVEDPPVQVDPLGQGDPRQQQDHFNRFLARFNERLLAEPRQQAPLMVEVSGRFTSFFADAAPPRRPSQIKEDEARQAAAAAKASGAEGQPGELGPTPAPDRDPAAAGAAEPAPLARGERPGRLVVVGDADFLRDDFVNGTYRQAGGPVSILAGVFFLQLLDWLAGDRDLVALQSRLPVDRTLQLVAAQNTGIDVRAAEQALLQKTQWLRGVNWLVPPLLLAGFGLVLFGLRRAQKQRFLRSVS